MKAEPQEDIQTILEAYEAELTCPICCDIFVGAHVSNPCGHTCCGECGHMWLARNKSAPTCAICRSSLSDIKPLLPNFAVDNLVRQHLQALASSGQSDWQNKGGKLVSWNNRLESWKKRAAVTRAAEVKAKEPARQYRLRSHHYRAEEYLHYHIPPWVVDRGIIEDEEED
ncbi:hypothetical protein BDN67DRAFT_961641 [Paxillus ammoniavirescens]|nr:hypothetical protein BDN67DRAFT_961641 [Paxillus ammoniavirescens]